METVDCECWSCWTPPWGDRLRWLSVRHHQLLVEHWSFSTTDGGASLASFPNPPRQWKAFLGITQNSAGLVHPGDFSPGSLWEWWHRQIFMLLREAMHCTACVTAATSIVKLDVQAPSFSTLLDSEPLSRLVTCERAIPADHGIVWLVVVVSKFESARQPSQTEQTRAGHSVQAENWAQYAQQLQNWWVWDVPMQRRHHDGRTSAAALPTARCSEAGHVAWYQWWTSSISPWQPGGAQEDSCFCAGDWHLYLVHNDEEAVGFDWAVVLLNLLSPPFHSTSDSLCSGFLATENPSTHCPFALGINLTLLFAGARWNCTQYSITCHILLGPSTTCLPTPSWSWSHGISHSIKEWFAHGISHSIKEWFAHGISQSIKEWSAHGISHSIKKWPAHGISQSIKEWFAHGISQSIKEWFAHSISQSIKEWSAHGISHSIKKWPAHGISQSIKEWSAHGISHSIKEWFAHGISQSIKEWFAHGISQSIKEWFAHGISQSINEWSAHGISHGIKEWSAHGISHSIKEWFAHGISHSIKDWSAQVSIEFSLVAGLAGTNWP